MKKVLSIISLVAIMVFAGCDKYLDLEPSQSISENVALDSDENVKNVLIGAYALLNYYPTDPPQPGIYGGNILRDAELLSGTGEILWVGTYTDPRELFTKNILTTNSEVYFHWRDAYAIINTVNNILSALDVVNEDDRDRVEGEALFLRGLMYFDLVRFFGPQYEDATKNTPNRGVPLVLTPTRGINENIFVGRNTIEEVYNQVIADLKTAASQLDEENEVYATSGAANALLARVYLQKGDYSNARTAAHSVITSDIYELQSSYADVFNNDDNSAEDIFATQITPQDRYSSMTEFFSIPMYGGRTGDIDILDSHLNLYPADDERKDLFYFGNGAMRTGKWNNQYGVINLIRLAEMYLIRAECNQRLGAPYVGPSPVQDYNTIHERAGLTPAGSVTLADIIYERRLELAFEGHYLHDLRRLKQNVGSLLYNSAKLVFPIPARELEANPIMKTQQNEGY